MNKDNKLEQKAYNKYYELKDYLDRLQDEYQICHTYYMNESDTRQRAKAKKDLDDVNLRIRRTQQEMDKIKNSIHFKDSMDILKLSGFTVDEEVSPKFKKVMEEYGKGELKSSSGKKVTDPKQAKAIAYSEAGEAKDDDATEGGAIEQYGKDGGPGSGIKGHTTSEDPDTKYKNFMAGKKKPLTYSEGKKLLEEAKKAGIHPDYLKGMEMGLSSLSKDECGEKVFTKGTEDAISYTESQLIRAEWSTWQHIVNNPGKYSPETVAIAQKLLRTKQKFENTRGAKDAKFEIMYTIGHFQNPETLKDRKEIIQANSAGEARRIIENREKGNLNRIIQITQIHDSDPKVAEAEAIINLCGGVK